MPAKGAVTLADSVSTLVPAVGLGLKVAVTPEGSPDALKLTLLPKPFWPSTVMVTAAVLPPFTFVDPTEVARVKEVPVAGPFIKLTLWVG